MRNAILVVGLAAAAASPAAPLDKDALTALAHAYAATWQAGSAPNLAALYGEDALLMPPDAGPVRGRAAIAQYFQASFAANGPMTFTPQSLETRDVGEAVVDLGTWRIEAVGAGAQPVALEGDYLVILEPAADGAWRITRHIWNLTPPAAP